MMEEWNIGRMDYTGGIPLGQISRLQIASCKNDEWNSGKMNG